MRLTSLAQSARLITAGILMKSSFALAAVSVPASAVYIPDGFDDNDEALVVVEGSLPTTCYQLTSPLVTKDESKQTIHINLQANINAGNCVPTPVPFSQEIEIGALATGTWRVTVAGRTSVQELRVTHSTTVGPDDYIYAPIDRVRAERNAVSGKWEISIRGKISASCLQWKEARLLVQAHVLVVLPILEQIGTDCLPVTEAFTHTVELPDDLSAGRYLIHARSLNGRALNTLFNFSR